MISCIDAFAPEEVEAGVGLALQDEARRYIFFLAGSRHKCPPGELFYGGIGGHREPGESWLDCGRREAREEVNTEIIFHDSAQTWHITQHGDVEAVTLSDEPRPYALYTMIHPPDTPRAGELYRLVIYQAQLQSIPQDLPPDELAGVIAVTAEQVRLSLHRKPKLQTLLDEGAAIISGAKTIQPDTHLYPIGTAKALAYLMNRVP